MAIVTSLTTEVGPRLAGSEAEARARVWALNTLTEKGFANVRNELFEMDAWERHEEGAEILARSICANGPYACVPRPPAHPIAGVVHRH